MKKMVLFVFGTRPEAIKLAPVIRAFQACNDFQTRVCVTAQHREMLDQFLAFSRIHPDCDLDVMSPDQSLPELTCKVIAGCAGVFAKLKPELVIVQGDTTSAFAAALAASFAKIPVAHVEAGLRSHRRDSPFPEEINRTLIARVAELHFAHSPGAAENLQREGLVAGVHTVGNTIVDSLEQTLRLIAEGGDAPYLAQFPEAGRGGQILLVTLHRRESFGGPLARTCRALRRLAEAHPELAVFYPVHPNPNVRNVVQEALAGLPNLRLLNPLTYPAFVWLLSHSTLVLSDSGGVLEEAETLGLPVLIAREVTERTEAIDTGNARLVGFDEESIFAEATALLQTGPAARTPDQPLRHTFGDGRTSERILEVTRRFLSSRSATAAPSPAAPLAMAS